MEISLGELADRLVIDLRKRRVMGSTQLDKEIDQLQNFILPHLSDTKIQKRLLQDMLNLADINYAIWELEYDIRMGKFKEEDLAIIGARAIKIRDLNSIRVGIKNSINKYSGTGFSDLKINHCSEKNNA